MGKKRSNCEVEIKWKSIRHCANVGQSRHLKGCPEEEGNGRDARQQVCKGELKETSSSCWLKHLEILQAGWKTGACDISNQLRRAEVKVSQSVSGSFVSDRKERFHLPFVFLRTTVVFICRLHDVNGSAKDHRNFSLDVWNVTFVIQKPASVGEYSAPSSTHQSDVLLSSKSTSYLLLRLWSGQPPAN